MRQTNLQLLYPILSVVRDALLRGAHRVEVASLSDRSVGLSEGSR